MPMLEYKKGQKVTGYRERLCQEIMQAGDFLDRQFKEWESVDLFQGSRVEAKLPRFTQYTRCITPEKPDV